MNSAASYKLASSPIRLTVWGLKASKIMRLWNQVNKAHAQNDALYSQLFHQLLHDMGEFSAHCHHDVSSPINPQYNAQLNALIDLLLDASFEKFHIEKLNAYVKTHWKDQALLAAKEITPYFYKHQLLENRRSTLRRTEQGCRRKDPSARLDDRRQVDRRRPLAI